MDAGHSSEHHSGFTLIELMVVVTMIGILVAIATPNFLSLTTRALEASVKANMKTLQLMIEEYSILHGFNYPMDSYTFVTERPENFVNPFNRGEPIGSKDDLKEGEVCFEHTIFGIGSYTIMGAGKEGRSLELTLFSGF